MVSSGPGTSLRRCHRTHDTFNKGQASNAHPDSSHKAFLNDLKAPIGAQIHLPPYIDPLPPWGKRLQKLCCQHPPQRSADGTHCRALMSPAAIVRMPGSNRRLTGKCIPPRSSVLLHSAHPVTAINVVRLCDDIIALRARQENSHSYQILCRPHSPIRNFKAHEPLLLT